MTEAVDWSTEVLSFWYEELAETQWWTSTPELDQSIRDRFLSVHRQAVDAGMSQLIETAPISLAAVITLDQFPRNMFRGTGAAFATDAKAMAVMDAALVKGYDVQLTATQRQFLYMPCMHAEDTAHQARAVDLFTALGNADNLQAAYEHADIIQRFGRFPHRNAALGRRDTPAEAAYLSSLKKRLGQ